MGTIDGYIWDARTCVYVCKSQVCVCVCVCVCFDWYIWVARKCVSVCCDWYIWGALTCVCACGERVCMCVFNLSE